MESFLGRGALSGGLDMLLTAYLANQQNKMDTQAMQNNTNLLGTSTQLAAAMGNEKLPRNFELTQYDSSGNPYTAQIGTGYNPVEDLLNYQKGIRGDQYSGLGTMEGNYRANKAGMANLNNIISSQTRGVGDKMMSEFDRGAAGTLDSYSNRSGAFQRDLRAAGDEVMAGYGARHQRGLDNLRGMGDQARRNINEQFNVNASNIGQSLASRGLGNTTIRQSMATGNERERARAIGELDESIRAQRLNTDASLWGDSLGARQQIESQRAAAANEALNMRTQMEGSNWANRMNLLGNTQTNNLNADVAGANRNYGLESGYGNDLLAFDSAIGQRRQELGTMGAQNVLSILTGTNFGYPGSSSMDAIKDMWGGLGGYEATRDAMNIQDKQYEQSLTAGMLGGFMNPVNAFTGGFAGSYGYSLGQR